MPAAATGCLCTEQVTTQLLDDLRWLGLHWDNDGDNLVYQSRRREIYDKIIDDLIARGLAYEAYETREELAAMRKEAEKARFFAGLFDPSDRSASTSPPSPRVSASRSPSRCGRRSD